MTLPSGKNPLPSPPEGHREELAPPEKVDRFAVEDLWRGTLLALLVLAVFGAFALHVGHGAVALGWGETLDILLGRSHAPQQEAIIWQFRLPRAVTAAVAGSALAVAGLLMQTLFANPLAGPYVLGVDAGASLGVALAVMGLEVLGPSWEALSTVGSFTAAWIGAVLVLLGIFSVARHVRSGTVLLLVGILFGFAANAVVSILVALAPSEKVHGFLTWSMGSFAAAPWPRVRLLALGTLGGLGMAWGLAKSLDALLLGEDYAATMGVTPGAARLRVLLATALLAGSATARCGPVAFLGIATPHLCRGLLRTEGHRWLLPACAAAGGALALGADTLARLPGGLSLPLNAVLALVGVPVVAWVLFRSAREGDRL